MIGRLDDKDAYNQKCHIIGIGVDKYKYKDWSSLKNCQADVERFIEMTCSSFKTFEDTTSHVTRLFDHNATKSLIETTIRGKIDALGQHENLIIYFAGHGSDFENQSYLVPHDAQTEYVNPNKSKFISFNDIFNWIDNKNALHIVLILDCCHGGQVMNAKRATKPKYSEDYLNKYLPESDLEYMMKTKSAWVITSGSGAQKVGDGDTNGSPFSQTLMTIFESVKYSERPMSIAQIGVHLKTRFPKKFKNQKPDFKPLSDILGYEQTGGEFVFEPKPPVMEVPKPVYIIRPPIIKPQFETSLQSELDFRPFRPISYEYPTQPSVFDGTPIQYQPDYIKRINEDVKKTLNLAQNLYPRKKRILGSARFFLFSLMILIILICNVFSKEITEFYTVLIIEEEEYHTIPIGEREFVEPPIPPFSLPRLPEELIKVVDIPQKIKRKYLSVFNKPFYNVNEKDTIKDNLVFVGSFQIKDNAEALKERLQNIGYQKTEIIMKEDLPYAVVVTGFENKNKAKSEVKAIKKRGIEVYSSKTDLSKIYRK
jgi:Caspase domain/SPOR domain